MSFFKKLFFTTLFASGAVAANAQAPATPPAGGKPATDAVRPTMYSEGAEAALIESTATRAGKFAAVLQEKMTDYMRGYDEMQAGLRVGLRHKQAASREIYEILEEMPEEVKTFLAREAKNQGFKGKEPYNLIFAAAGMSGGCANMQAFVTTEAGNDLKIAPPPVPVELGDEYARRQTEKNKLYPPIISSEEAPRTFDTRTHDQFKADFSSDARMSQEMKASLEKLTSAKDPCGTALGSYKQNAGNDMHKKGGGRGGR